MGSYIFRENSQPVLRVVPSPQEAATAAIATAAPIAPRNLILIIANIFSFIVLHFHGTGFFQQAFDLLVVCIVIGIYSNDEPVIRSAQVHNPWRTAWKEVIAIEKCSNHTQRRDQNRTLKSYRHKVG